MIKRKKSVVAILIIGVCTVFFLSWKCFWPSHEIEKKGQEERDALLSNEETALLLNKIQNLLGESAGGRKTDEGDTERTFRSQVHQDEGQVQSSENQRTVADKGLNNKGIERIVVSSEREKQHHGNSLYGSDYGAGKTARVDGSIKINQMSDAQKPANGVQIGGGGFFSSRWGTSSTSNSQGPDLDNVVVTSSESSSSDPNTKSGKPQKKSDDLKPTPFSVDFFGSINAKEGSLVLACNSEGKVFGKARVKKNGMYGILHVCIETPGSEESDGMKVGEQIIFMVDGKRAIPLGPDQDICQGGSDLKHVNLEVDVKTESRRFNESNV